MTSLTRYRLAAPTIAYAIPVLPEVESMIVLRCVSSPRCSPSTIIESAARSFTEPPGLNHSALAYTSSPGNSRSNSLTRSSGVLPISPMMPALTVRCAISSQHRNQRLPAANPPLSKEVRGGHADDHEDPAQHVSDHRTSVDRPSLRREDVEDGLADQEAAAEDRDAGRSDQDAKHEHGAEGQDLDELKEGIGRHLIGQSLGEVVNYVVGRLDSDRHADRPRPHSELGALRGAEAAMRGYLRVRDRGLHAAEAGGEPDHLEARQHLLHGRAAAVEVECEHPSSSLRHQPQRDLVRRRALERRVINGGYPGHPSQGSSEGDAVVAVPAHADVQGAEAAQREPGVEWPQGAPCAYRSRARGRYYVRAPDHNPRDQV